MNVLQAAALIALIAGPAAAAPRACPNGLHAAATAELYFGRNPGQELAVSDADWRDFIDREVSPQFSDGLSVGEVYGQWRATGGQFVREPTKVVFLVLSGAPSERRNLDAVRDAYQHRFHRRSVLMVQQTGCVSF